MLEYAIKVAISALLIVAVTEISKRSTLLGAALASLPITSLLAFVWLYWDTGDAGRVADLATNILWLALVSMIFFVSFPVLIKAGWQFWPSLSVSLVLTAAAYLAMAFLLKRLGIGD
ncbi:MAG: DUF3147 family protein [Hyphomicrobiaceae bacterium]